MWLLVLTDGIQLFVYLNQATTNRQRYIESGNNTVSEGKGIYKDKRNKHEL